MGSKVLSMLAASAALASSSMVLAADDARTSSAPARAKVSTGSAAEKPSKPWCAPEVMELSDHVCYFEGGVPADGRRTLVVYLHGSLAPTPAFQYLQQRAMAIHAKRRDFTVLIPTSPMIDGYYVWPTGRAAQEAHEAGVLAGIREARTQLEAKLGVHYDETFVVGFSSGAYYGSSLALRGALDVDGYIILAGGSSWARPDRQSELRAPVFVGVSALDKQTAQHSRALASTLGTLHWPYRVEERDAGHMVDWGLLDHGLSWLRQRARSLATK